MNDPQGMTPNYSGVPNGSGVKVNIISLVFNSLAAVLSIVVFCMCFCPILSSGAAAEET